MAQLSSVVMKRFYLAYGSNLHPLRLRERVASAQLVGTVALPGRRIAFRKRSDVDASGKADLVSCGNGECAYGAVFEINPAQKRFLDAAEGLGIGYREETMTVTINAVHLEVFTYLANPTHINAGLRPFCWYKALVVAGARFHGFPEDYIRQLEAVPALEDHDPERRRANRALLKNMGR
jgi:hypothetical protein